MFDFLSKNLNQLLNIFLDYYANELGIMTEVGPKGVKVFISLRLNKLKLILLMV